MHQIISKFSLKHPVCHGLLHELLTFGSNKLLDTPIQCLSTACTNFAFIMLFYWPSAVGYFCSLQPINSLQLVFQDKTLLASPIPSFWQSFSFTYLLTLIAMYSKVTNFCTRFIEAINLYRIICYHTMCYNALNTRTHK